VDGRYLEDASGLRGHAERLIVPADESALTAVLREASGAGPWPATPVTIPGAGTGVTGAREASGAGPWPATPVTIAGAGTGVTGARVPQGGWVISLEKFTRLEVHPGYAIAGAGVLLKDLHAAAQRTGQFYPPDPTETSASIGGTIATNASGARSFRYGPTRRWIERLRVAFADGTVREFARGEASLDKVIDFDPGEIPLPDVTKNTAGYLLRPGMDWIDLFTGSEGTLGVVTEARLKLLPEPKAILSGVIFFPGDQAAIDAVERWRASASARMLEYFDDGSLRLLRTRFAEIPPKAHAGILFEQELASEDDPEVDAWAERVEAAGALADDSWFALSAADRERFRRFRHALPELVNDAVRRDGTLKMGSDFAVPLARNREMLTFYKQRLETEFPGRYVIFGHVGDAHVHVNILSADAGPLLEEFARHAVALGGTVSAEHGLGKRKAHFLKLQYSEEDLEKMRAVKRRLDPKGILGRGTLWRGPMACDEES
jgi:FAD/FMN-containing dehydrogenase